MSTIPPNTRTTCVKCGSKTVSDATIDETAKFRYDGRLYNVHVPQLTVNQCANCGAIFYDNRADKQISRALRDQLKLLQPEQIQAKRIELELTQVQLCSQIHVAPESLSRWENGHVIQSKSHDHLLRLFFALKEVRECSDQWSWEVLEDDIVWCLTGSSVGTEIFYYRQDIDVEHVDQFVKTELALAA